MYLSVERLDQEFTFIDNATKDIYDEFSYLKLAVVREALRKGSLGYFGKTYKLNTQTVCYWIIQHRDSLKSKLGI